MSVSQQPSFQKGFKFRIYPTIEQKVLFDKTFGCCRYVWNKALAESQLEYSRHQTAKEQGMVYPKPSVKGYDFVNKLPSYKANLDSLWLSEVSAVALQQTLLHLGSAFSAFFKQHKDYPQAKKKHQRQSFAMMRDTFRFIGGQLFVAKSKEPLAVGFSRLLPSEPSSAVISKTPTGKYFISFICAYIPQKTVGQGKIGVDLGIKDFLVTSDDMRITNPKHYARYQRQLKRRQQFLSRKQKGSQNRHKARLAVAKQYERITNCRTDFLHQLSRKLINENQVIGLERPAVKNMIRNRRLAKSIADVAWSSFTTMLNYKARESQRCSLVYMDSFYPSSHICNVDQIKLDRKLSLSERSWVCPQCGTKHDRDTNAARNIRDEALTALALNHIPDSAGIILLANNCH
jgi:putative transposase